MELFLQTVSMKAVDNLNEFVRQHMLEPFDVSGQLKNLIAHFDDLTRAHTAVLRARAQLELLGPLVTDLDAHADLERGVAELTDQRRALPFVLADRKVALVQAQLGALQLQLERGVLDRTELSARIESLAAAERDLSIEIAGRGGRPDRRPAGRAGPAGAARR